MEPSPHTARSIAHANKNLPDTTVIHSTLPDHLQQISTQIQNLESPIPTIQGELRACDRMHLLPGVLSTRMWIKQRNHYSQTLLEKWAEPFRVFAGRFIADKSAQTKWADRTPAEIASNRVRNVAPLIRQAWRLVMENHPHDSICGCSIDQVHDEMKPRFDQADQIGDEITQQSLQAISLAVDTHTEEAFSAIVIFNPHGHPRRDLVEIELNIPEDIAAFELVDADLNVIPHEFLGSSNEALANLLLPKSSLRDTIGAINEGWVAGMALTRVIVSRQGSTVTIDSVLDENGQPNISEWRQAEADIAKYESDPGVTHFQVIAHTPQASKIRFVGPEIPMLGWQTVWVRALDVPASTPVAEVNPLLKPFLPLALRMAQSKLGEKIIAQLEAGDEAKPPFIIANKYFQVEASQTDGTLTVMDKQTNTVYAGLNRFVDGGDAGDEYNYCPPPTDAFVDPKVVALKVYRDRLVPTLEIEYALKVPTELSTGRKTRSQKIITIPILSRITLIPGVPRIDIHTEIDNQAKDHRLRVHFPAPFAVELADYDSHYEVVRRPIDVPEKGADWVEDPRPEVPQRAFTDISNGEIGLMLANRGLPEVEVIKKDSENNLEIALTLLRSVGWLSRDDMSVREGHAGPASETPGGQVLGKWGYDYALIPHAGDWKSAYQHAYSFETPLRAIETELHAGEIPSSGSFIKHTPADFVISAVKETEDGAEIIVRGYNISPEPIQMSMETMQKFSHLAQVNLAEEKIQDLNLDENGRINLTVNGHQIVTVRFTP